ncbi:MAG: NADH-quinone oxidoreductase subunit C [Verrucomicrobiae bacterium]|nr:NADH-quinone oxidoreductase subunit C [Verrucomicrobiae bacterium]
MPAWKILNRIKERFAAAVERTDVPANNRLFVHVRPGDLREVCRHVFRDMDARYVISIGWDDRPHSGGFVVSHHFSFDKAGVLCCVLVRLPGDHPKVDSVSEIIPGANWAEREFQDLLGICPEGHPWPKRLVLPDGWPEGVHPLRKDVAWNHVPEGYNHDAEHRFEDPPPGCVVVPFGPFHPTLDEPEHFRLYVEGEFVRGCEYRGFMVHRGIEKLGDSVLTYNDIPMAAERICGICGSVHNVAYAQAVEQAAALGVPLRAEYVRTIMLELERLHSHLLWVGLACHIVGFDTLFMQSFRIREPVMWMAEKISGNRKTYALCVIGGVRWEITHDLKDEMRAMLKTLEKEWLAVAGAVKGDRNLQKRTKGIGVTSKELVKEMGLVGPIARAAGVNIDCRRDLPYAAYDKVDFDVVVHEGGDVWSRVLVRVLEVFESIRIIRQCLDRMPDGPLQAKLNGELPVGRLGVSSVEAPRGESHHMVVTGENNRPRRWRVRAPTYQNLQGIPAMIKDQRLADMTISLGSIDPCFSCTDRVETLDIRTGGSQVYTQTELLQMTRQR